MTGGFSIFLVGVEIDVDKTMRLHGLGSKRDPEFVSLLKRLGFRRGEPKNGRDELFVITFDDEVGSTTSMQVVYLAKRYYSFQNWLHLDLGGDNTDKLRDVIDQKWLSPKYEKDLLSKADGKFVLSGKYSRVVGPSEWYSTYIF